MPNLCFVLWFRLRVISIVLNVIHDERLHSLGMTRVYLNT